MVLEAAISGGCRYIVTFNNETSKQRIRCPCPCRHTSRTPSNNRGCQMSTRSLRLPYSLHEEIKKLARREGISINQLVSTAVAEKLAALMTEEHLEKRARRGTKQKFQRVLRKVRSGSPADEDRL